ncbi:MAG: septal ring lytic transglycosylase RlpA family protein [Spirochaetes bacterium]|nr:septal ring lytic transglycosylase RlpA family protein [Spirochaetota bacterium]
MKSFIKSTVFIISGLMFFIMLAGCTPSRAQTRGNDYAGSFDSENYDEFDREEAGDDVIPAYTDTKSADKRESQVRTEKKYGETAARVKSGVKTEKDEDYLYDEKDSAGDRGVADDDNSYESGANADYNAAENFYQKGYASWYGREFHGKATASGEKFDMNLLTAAHKTLPFGTVLEVTNLENGKKVKLKINDRGPYRGNRIIDLSYNAAREIDMIKKGEVKVGIRVIKMGDNSVLNNTAGRKSEYVEPVSDDEYPYQEEKQNSKGSARGEDFDDYSEGSGIMKLQAGAFYSRRNAQAQKETIEALTDRPVKIIQEGEYFKIRIEGIQSRKELDRIKEVLRSENIQSFMVD